MSHLLVIDGNYYAYRIFFGADRMVSYKTQFPINILNGFTRKLNKILETNQYTHTVVVFDSNEPTHRHKLSPIYKAHRPPPPEDLTKQLGVLPDMLTAIGIPVIRKGGLEGDDLMGCLARFGVENDCLVTLSTGDKDMAQLIDHKVCVANHFNHMVYTLNNVEQCYGVPAHRIADMLALTGDAADGIIGLPGVGPKTAVKLINKYATFEELITSDDCARLLRSGNVSIEDIRIDRQLTEIVCDADLGITLEDLLIRKPDYESLDEIRSIVGYRGCGYLIQWCDDFGQ